MEHSAGSEITFHHEAGGDEFIKKVIKTTILLSVITIIELGLGLTMYAFPMADTFKLFLKGVIVILSLAKAFYIVGIFMHLGDELKNLIMTICVPLILFVWFIAAFLMDGNSWKNLRNSRGKSIVPIEKTAPAAHSVPVEKH
jgi:cytochrome c oxidase subunit 4